MKTTLADIAARMVGQDNQSTAHPIFMVRQRRRIYGMDPAYADLFTWVEDDELVEVSSKEAKRMEAEHDETGEEPGGFRRIAYIDQWEPVQPFFSRAGADAYIEANRHNLTDPMVYVDSAYRNYEWQAVRAALLEGETRDRKFSLSDPARVERAARMFLQLVILRMEDFNWDRDREWLMGGAANILEAADEEAPMLMMAVEAARIARER